MFAFLRYYMRLLARAPLVAVEAANNALLLLGVSIVGLAIFNRPLARKVSSWEGFSPYWAIVPFVVLLIYGLLKANHKNLLNIEKERDEAIKQRKEIQYNASVASQSPPTENYLKRAVQEAKERETEEVKRQMEIIRRLYREYMWTHDLIADPQYRAGLGPLPTQWVDKRLEEMGETWRRKHYTLV